MDKTWILKPRSSADYQQGLDQFLKFAFDNASKGSMILCLCRKCTNCFWKEEEVVYEHLLCDGFMQGYTRWIFHGEDTSQSNPTNKANIQNEQINDEMDELLHDAFFHPESDFDVGDLDTNDLTTEPDEETKKFYKLVKDANQEIYPGCKKFSKLSFIVRLLQIKCLGGWSNKSFDMLLKLLKEVLQAGETLPSSFYETDKIIKDLGLGYEKIDACPNNCMLYRKEFANASLCHVCGASRWKTIESKVSIKKSKEKHGHKVSAKVLRYFPLKPRLQRLFMSSKTASYMRWHNEGRTKDGLLRHPADSPAWKDFDHKHQLFSSEPRNVRLGLASDGFNPFRTMSISHSTWPVVLIPYNLPLWICMKQPYFILSLLIPGPSAPGNDIDVYMQPLIDELKELWDEGIKTYDVSCKQTFQMHAAILWTISDFPGYACLSGWSTKGQLACPYCNSETCSEYLKHGRKILLYGTSEIP
ncbi:uncharacterized protein LOC109716524 [Ananas comosus]|uniref:Uncharacterized protein LOC109716524 n=1 Tax=Ananas comosus TaxID=4615 RepID=A0A6P5FPN0_ANACO|nr:uncharacterized protein LOC109716524 [Ananas comosus]